MVREIKVHDITDTTQTQAQQAHDIWVAGNMAMLARFDERYAKSIVDRAAVLYEDGSVLQMFDAENEYVREPLVHDSMTTYRRVNGHGAVIDFAPRVIAQ